jgi:hypothetical protein
MDASSQSHRSIGNLSDYRCSSDVDWMDADDSFEEVWWAKALKDMTNDYSRPMPTRPISLLSGCTGSSSEGFVFKAEAQTSYERIFGIQFMLALIVCPQSLSFVCCFV